jgi:hypothetical protein
MHATRYLHNHVQKRCQAIHAKRLAALFAAVDALARSRRLSLTGLGRSLRSTAEVKHNIKRMDRLLANERLYAERESLYAAVVKLVISSARRPVIVVDWSELTWDRRFQLLRAAVPVGGRAVSIYEEVHPQSKLNNARVQLRFLRKLKALLGESCRPVLVTDAGFRAPWFKAVEKMGWDWIGRVRTRTLFQWPGSESWMRCKSLYARAIYRPRRLGLVRLTRSNPLSCYLYLLKNRKQGRVKRTIYGSRCQSHYSLTVEKRQREPWLLASSMDICPKKITRTYRCRMQIEENFRDMKSTRWGFSLRETRTRNAHRLSILVLIGTLAHLALWLLGKAGQRLNLHYRFQANTIRKHTVLSTFFLGSQILNRSTLPITADDLKRSLLELNSIVEQEVPA